MVGTADYISMAEAIGRRLHTPDVFAPETVEVLMQAKAVGSDTVKARRLLSYARDALAAYVPDDPLVGEADRLLNAPAGGPNGG